MKLLFQAEKVKSRSVFRLPEMLVWCGSMAQDTKGGCHLYFSAWERKYGFDAWVTHSKIGHAYAETPASEYQFRSWILPGSAGHKAWDRDVTHNPAIMKFDGKYYLYYMGNYSDTSEWWDHRNHQQVGVAWSETPEGPFLRSATPIIEQDDAVMISNPSVCPMPDGRFLMIYKWVAAKKPAPFYGPVCHGAAFADTPLGPFIPVCRNLFSVNRADFPGEDPFVFQKNGKLYCLVKDNGRNYSELSKALILFESLNGIDWKKLGAALSRDLIFEDGKRKRFFRMERPQLVSCHNRLRLFCAIKPSSVSDDSFSLNFELKTNLF